MQYVLLILVAQLLYPAPSAFGAGDLSSKTPYGLTSTEKEIFGNKKKIKKIIAKSNSQNQNIQSIKDDLSTIKSLVSSSLSSSSQFKKSTEKHLFDINEKITSLEEKINTLNASNEALKISFLGLKDILFHINDNFVSKEELDSIKKLIPKPKIKLSNKKIEILAKKAYKKKKYHEAKTLYETLVKNKYHPAQSSFYLGEVFYFQKKYNKAIEFYTKSVNLYSKSSYMGLLLYHTAKSYIYLGKKKQARDFFDSVISSFPKSRESAWSKKAIKKYYK